MQVNEHVDFNFIEKVPSDSRVLNPLGIQYHLSLQDELVPGITSVTNRIRYYTLQAWYYENLFDDKVMDSKDFERTFILACLAHHNGDSSHPGLRYVHNKQRFSGEWGEKDKFQLDFDISGFGRTYYVRQLEVFRCAWTDKLDRPHYTKLNQRLANTLDLPVEAFEKREFTKEYLKENLSSLCICNDNTQEIEVLSKIFFGFFSKQGDKWDLDEDEFQRFKEGEIELGFDGEFKDAYPSQEEETRQKNLRRRNTLFLFLKIISETEPSSLRRTIWDAIYYAQNREDHSSIEFGDLEKARKYWEFFQLNLYYVFAVETILDVLQRLIRGNNGIEQEDLLSKAEGPEFERQINDLLGQDCEIIGDALSAIEHRNGSKNTDLDSPINESELYTRIRGADDWQEKAAASLLLLLTLKFRYDQFSNDFKENAGVNSEENRVRGRLDISSMYEEVEARVDDTLVSFLQDLFIWTKRQHVFEASRRLRNSNTRAWIFTEEEGRFYFARQSPISVGPRDNRWGSMESLLTDLKFVEEQDDKTVLTEKGEEWLQRIE